MTTIPTGHQAPAPTTLVRPPSPALVPAPFAPSALQLPVDGQPPMDRVTAYAVACGGSATAYAVASAPAAGPAALQPDAPTPRRSWRTAAVVVAALAVTAVGCGVLAVAYPSLVRVWQVAGYVSTVAGAAAAWATPGGWRRGAGAR
ncbi:hypothetical protein ACFXPQ_33465 [Streptomyces lydicus]|uniref:hypothetical protein n=1 Tax=Streptomyces lydicus TaxID=47763 RepID=UPI0036B77BDF